MKRLIMLGFLSLLLAVFTSGCGGEGDQGKAGSAAEDAGMTVTVASVSGKVITEGEVAAEETAMMRQMRGRVDPEQMESMKPAMRQQAVANLVNRTLLEQAADREGIKVTPEETDAKMKEIEANFPSAEAFDAELGNNNLTRDEFRAKVFSGIKIEKLIEIHTADVGDVTDDEIKEYYDANIDRFKQPERVKASHILVKFEPGDTEAIKLQKRAKIDSLHREVLSGADFAELASTNSDCPSKANGGDLGFFGRGQMVKPFEDVAFSLKKGDVSGIVETDFGYHIIKLTDREDARTIPIYEVRDDIASYLESQKKQKKLTEYIDSLRGAANIEYSDSSLVEQTD